MTTNYDSPEQPGSGQAPPPPWPLPSNPVPPGHPAGPYGPGWAPGSWGPAGPGSPGGPWGPGPGGAWSTGPGGPGGPGLPGGPSEPPAKQHRFRRRLLIVGVAAVVAVAAFWGVQNSGAISRTPVLTTSQIVAKVDAGLVDVYSTMGYQGAEGAGTGMVLTSSGVVLTNNHVIEGATSLRAVDIGNGRTYRAKVIGYDRSHDVAVIKLQNASGLQTVTLGNSASVQIGQKVVAIGNAGGKGGTPSVVTGHVIRLNAAITATDSSAGTSEHLRGLIGHNAPIQPGDSGGPLVNTAGQVVGIDTAASGGFQFQGGQSQTQAFAIPINTAMNIARQIRSGTATATVHIGATGFLGVGVLSASQARSYGLPAHSGAVVAGVFGGSPASRAGLARGDVIDSVNGHAVTSPLDLQKALEQHHPGDQVTIGWTTQGGQSRSATVVLEKGPAG